ncbi:unnamed protein product [Acanthoscelides obtectus]|uniref:Uncharacterized protein n=1 Tax=Acanthoscelides obtectus TaxID=200917 RepID=A0A9P0K480_ACAOB|nr:unnamed protein product [Acanthoscelides obtectus]CAK1648047.1 hypothetical protein AOBTE_LOCUS15519 [Acanthoscelides obtectus]
MRNKTKAAWQEIIDTFIYENLNEAEKAEIAKTLLQKWNNFFDSFVKSYKKNKTPKSGSGFRRIRKYHLPRSVAIPCKNNRTQYYNIQYFTRKNTETMAQQNVDDSSNEGDSQID